jgi:hypothetical protein
MKTRLLITDVTRMSGDRVCVAAINQSRQNVRPVLPYGISESWLYQQSTVVVRPFSIISLDLHQNLPQPPHTEDWSFNPGSLSFERLLEVNSREKCLTEILDPDVASIFGAEIQTDSGCYLQAGEGSRSLGTIKVQQIERFDHSRYDSWDYRLYFRDASSIRYHLKVTDLSLRYYVDALRETQHLDCKEIGQRLTQAFQQSQVFLRIGLARKWHPDRDQPQNPSKTFLLIYPFKAQMASRPRPAAKPLLPSNHRGLYFPRLFGWTLFRRFPLNPSCG